MTAIYDYNQGIVNFKKFALQWVLIRLSRFSYNGIGSPLLLLQCVSTKFDLHYNITKVKIEEIDLIELLIRGVCSIKDDSAQAF